MRLPLLRPSVLADAAQAGVGLLTWENDTFAYAEGYDAEAQHYRGMHCSVDLRCVRMTLGCL